MGFGGWWFEIFCHAHPTLDEADLAVVPPCPRRHIDHLLLPPPRPRLVEQSRGPRRDGRPNRPRRRRLGPAAPLRRPSRVAETAAILLARRPPRLGARRRGGRLGRASAGGGGGGGRGRR